MADNDAEQLSNVNGHNSVASAHRNHKLQRSKQHGRVSKGQARELGDQHPYSQDVSAPQCVIQGNGGPTRGDGQPTPPTTSAERSACDRGKILGDLQGTMVSGHGGVDPSVCFRER